MIDLEVVECFQECIVWDEERAIVLIVRIWYLCLVSGRPHRTTITPRTSISVNIPRVAHMDQVSHYISVGVFQFVSANNGVGVTSRNSVARTTRSIATNVETLVEGVSNYVPNSCGSVVLSVMEECRCSSKESKCFSLPPVIQVLVVSKYFSHSFFQNWVPNVFASIAVMSEYEFSIVEWHEIVNSYSHRSSTNVEV